MIKFPLPLYEHQKKVYEICKNRDYFALFHDMGCLDGDTIVKINRGGGSKEYTLEEAYKRFHCTWDKEIPTMIRSFKKDHIGLNEIDDIVKSGIKTVFTLTLKNGFYLKATKDHKIQTKEGMIKLSDLKENDFVMIDILKKHKKKEIKVKKNKPRYNLRNVGIYHPYSQNAVCRGKNIKRVEVHRLVYEANLNNMNLEDFQEATYSKNNLKFVNSKKFYIHHIDNNTKNNCLSNLKKMDAKDHFIHHGKVSYKNFGHGEPEYSQVISIKKFGEAMTYDICCKAPHHNFVANGIVCHNSGKTCSVISIARFKYAIYGRVLKTLILTPLSVVEQFSREWVKFGGERYGEKEVLAITGIKQQKFKKIENHKGNIFVLNHDSLNVKDLYEWMEEKKFEFLVVDESASFKNHASKRTKALIKLADNIKYKFIMTGTPITNGLTNIWSQFRIMNRDIFPSNFYVFRGKYMIDKNAKMIGKTLKYFPDYRPRPGAEEDLNRIIYKHADRVMKSECLDLPELTKMKVFVELTPEQNKHYQEMKKTFITFLNNEACVAEIALTKSLRLQQIVAGIFKTDTGEVKLLKNNRINVLKEQLEIICIENKCIVWSTFADNYNQISKACDELNIKYVFLTGKQNQKEKQESIDAFQNDNSVKVIIANQAAGGIGVNLTAASYAIYYTKTFNYEHDAQSEARNYRSGSEIHNKITRIDLVTPCTIDEIILESLANKENTAETILRLKKML